MTKQQDKTEIIERIRQKAIAMNMSQKDIDAWIDSIKNKQLSKLKQKGDNSKQHKHQVKFKPGTEIIIEDNNQQPSNTDIKDNKPMTNTQTQDKEYTYTDTDIHTDYTEDEGDNFGNSWDYEEKSPSRNKSSNRNSGRNDTRGDKAKKTSFKKGRGNFNNSNKGSPYNKNNDYKERKKRKSRNKKRHGKPGKPGQSKQSFYDSSIGTPIESIGNRNNHNPGNNAEIPAVNEQGGLNYKTESTSSTSSTSYRKPKYIKPGVNPNTHKHKHKHKSDKRPKIIGFVRKNTRGGISWGKIRFDHTVNKGDSISIKEEDTQFIVQVQ